MSLNLATMLRESANKNPTKTHVIVGDVEIPYAMTHGISQKFGGALQELGVKRGEHVALMLPNVPHFTMSYFGCHYAANPVVPLNVLLTPDEIAYHLEDSDATAIVVWEMFYEQAKAAFDRVDSCKHIIIAKADKTDVTAPEGAHNFNKIAMAANPITDVPDTNADDTAVILYTSGTTGRPKGAELSHFNLFFNARDMATMPGCPVEMSESRALVCLPLFHSFGQTVLQNATTMAGGTLVLMPRFDPTQAAQLIKKHKVDVFAGVPTMYFALLNHPEVEKESLSSLKHCMSGGSAMPVEVMNEFDTKFGVNILEGYGLSETSPVASFNNFKRAKKAGSIGLPIWGVEFRLVDDDGKVVDKIDEPGEIQIKGHNVMKGYYKRPEANAESIADGWFRSGDIGTRDDDGFYYIVDRKKDMIIRGGYNVYPREIEEVLYAHAAIAEAAVIGVPHEKHGEEVKAVVALKPDAKLTGDELIAFCKEKLAAYKYPRLVEIIDELPKGATGKILKRELKA
jgi:long-chain acyl-CoA synthetase